MDYLGIAGWRGDVQPVGWLGSSTMPPNIVRHLDPNIAFADFVTCQNFLWIFSPLQAKGTMLSLQIRFAVRSSSRTSPSKLSQIPK